MDIQLLINEEIIKGILPVSANISGDYLKGAMFEAQELGLKNILGSTLLRTLKDYEARGEWHLHPELEDLKNRTQLYLAYKTMQEVLPKVSYKVANIGAVQTSDQNVQNLSREQVDVYIEEYSSKADALAYELQQWMLKAIDEQTAGSPGMFRIYLTTADGEYVLTADGERVLVRGARLIIPEDEAYEIKSNLYSAASCGIWLGGARGQRL